MRGDDFIHSIIEDPEKEKKSNSEKEEKPEFVKWFFELTKDSTNIVGGKGANLSEIYNLGVPVPPGFVITAQAYAYFIEKAGIREKILEKLSGLDYEETEKLENVAAEIRERIVNAKMPKEMEQEIVKAYDSLDTDAFDFDKKSGLSILNTSSEPMFVAVRSSATAEDGAETSFAGQQESFLNIKGHTSLIIHIKRCFASLFTARSVYYRNKNNIDNTTIKIAVVVQKMVDSDKSGVIFSKDPTYKKDNVIIEAVFGLGEGIVSGQITPDKYVLSKDLELLDKKISYKKIAITRDSSGSSITVNLTKEKAESQVLKEAEIKKLAQMALKLEEHYNKPQDIEFAIEGAEIFLVQTRPITTLKTRLDKSSEGQKMQGEIILSGLAASPGIASGKVKIVKTMADLKKVKTGDVLVTEMTNPDMVVTMQKASAIVTDEGGLTAHAAIVSREMGIPCVVGTGNATQTLREEQIVSVDGFNGKVYSGATKEVKKEIEKVTANTRTEIKVIVDMAEFAERASQTGLKKVGLTRLEGTIAESGKHPNYFIKSGKYKDYEEIIFKGVEGIAKYFEEIWVRTSDIRSDEYAHLEGAPKEIEANPMLGMHGIRFSIINPEFLKAELNALKRVASKGTRIGVLLPQVINVEEVQKVKEVLREIHFESAKLGVMVETPAAVQIIKELCEEGIKFISFGTNDLTQYILAIDRGNEKCQSLYNEMHPAVLNQLDYVIRVCKRYAVETSICGQAASKKDMVKFLVDKGIDSLSTNADVAKEIADFVADLEKQRGESPRQYHPDKKELEID